MIVRNTVGAALMLATLVLACHAAELDTEILSQGGATVTMADVDAFMQRIPANQRIGFLDSPKRIDQMMINILRDKQLANQAVELKIDQDPAVKAQLAFARNETLSRARMDAFEASLKIPPMDKAAKEEYLAHKAQYVIPESDEVQHVLISEKGRSEADAKALAEKVHADALANPAAFDDLVSKYSDDPSKVDNNGHIVDASSDKMAKEFAYAAKKLAKPGDISPIVKTQFGYHVLKLIRKSPAREVVYAAVKDKIEGSLKDNFIAEQRRLYLAKLDEGKPVVNPQIMELLRQHFNPNDVLSPTDAAMKNTP